MLRKFTIPRTLPSSTLGLLYVLVLIYLNKGMMFLKFGLMEIRLLGRIIRITLVGMLRLCRSSWRMWIDHWQVRREM